LQNEELSAFHQPAGIDPGGHEFEPAFIEQHIAVHPESHPAAGPHRAAYAVPGRSRKRSGFTARAEPTTAVFIRKLRRVV
jgi:hypothetical protein